MIRGVISGRALESSEHWYVHGVFGSTALHGCPISDEEVCHLGLLLDRTRYNNKQIATSALGEGVGSQLPTHIS